MKKQAKNIFPTLIKLSFLFCTILASGALGKSFFMRECSNIAKEMKIAENDIRILNRENDFWDAQIAKMQAPAYLRAKAGTTLMPPTADKIVLAYEVTEILPNGKTAQRRVLSRRSTGIASTFKTAKR